MKQLFSCAKGDFEQSTNFQMVMLIHLVTPFKTACINYYRQLTVCCFQKAEDHSLKCQR